MLIFLQKTETSTFENTYHLNYHVPEGKANVNPIFKVIVRNVRIFFDDYYLLCLSFAEMNITFLIYYKREKILKYLFTKNLNFLLKNKSSIFFYFFEFFPSKRELSLVRRCKSKFAIN